MERAASAPLPPDGPEPPPLRAAPGGEPLLVQGVHKRWGDRDVLAGAELAVRAGSVVWVGGANGAGKTTLLRIAAGMIDADSGSVASFGLRPDHDRRAHRARVGFLSAGDRGLYARLTVRQNVELGAGLALLPRARRREAVATAVARFGLEELERRRVDRLSMGQRQRVRLALATVHEPLLLLLDEPHTSLDEQGLGVLAAALEALVARGGAAVWCAPAIDRERLPVDEGYVIEGGMVRRA